MNRAVSTTKPRGPTVLTVAMVVGAVLAAYMVWDSGSVPAVSLSSFQQQRAAISGDEAPQGSVSARASEHKLVELQQQQQATQALIEEDDQDFLDGLEDAGMHRFEHLEGLEDDELLEWDLDEVEAMDEELDEEAEMDLEADQEAGSEEAPELAGADWATGLEELEGGSGKGTYDPEDLDGIEHLHTIEELEGLDI